MVKALKKLKELKELTRPRVRYIQQGYSFRLAATNEKEQTVTIKQNKPFPAFLHRFTVLLLFCCSGLAYPLRADELPTVLPTNVKIVHFPSATLGDERTMLVMLPVDYDAAVRRYPVLYLLHGADADITDWARGTNLSEYASHHQLIIVTPDASRSWYVNSVANPKAHYDDYIMKDVIGYIDKNFRTIPEPFARAIAGVSMGGYGAVLLGLEHRDQFAAIGSFSGALSAAHVPPPLPKNATEEEKKERQEYTDLVGAPGSKEQKARDPFELIQNIPVEEIPMLFIVCGGQDGNIESTHAFLIELSKRRIPYEYREISPRAHEWRVWNEEIPVFLDMLDRLNGFPSSRPKQ
jgi:putative tributyrin esterase